MKTNELRIGNWIKRNLPTDMSYAKVLEIIHNGLLVQDKDGYVGCSMNFIEPIELTEEVLVKIGFEKDGGIYYYEKDIHQLRIEVYERYIYLCYCELVHIPMDVTEIERSCGLDFNKRNFRYLHQLQNAYYLLTSQELEVEL